MKSIGICASASHASANIDALMLSGSMPPVFSAPPILSAALVFSTPPVFSVPPDGRSLAAEACRLGLWHSTIVHAEMHCDKEFFG